MFKYSQQILIISAVGEDTVIAALIPLLECVVDDALVQPPGAPTPPH